MAADEATRKMGNNEEAASGTEEERALAVSLERRMMACASYFWQPIRKKRYKRQGAKRTYVMKCLLLLANNINEYHQMNQSSAASFLHPSWRK